MKGDQYGRWLRQGRGFAILRADEAPRDRLDEILLDACTHWTGIDRQSEGSRAEYLFDVLVKTGTRDPLEAPILAALPHRDSWDREQLLELAYLFVLDGSAAAEQAIRETFLRSVEEVARPGAVQLVAVSGLSGLALVAHELGRVLTKERADEWELQPLQIAETDFGTDAAAEVLTRGAVSDPYIRRYSEAVQVYRASKAQRVPGPPRPLPFALTFEALAGSSIDRTSRWVFRRWGREAPEGELLKAAAALGAVSPEVRLRILLAFEDRKFPGPPGALLQLLNSDDEELVDRTWSALRHLDVEEVRVRAKEDLSRLPPKVEALRGLQKGLRSDEVPWVASVLAGITDEDEIHTAGLILRDAVDEGGGPHLAPLLLTLYERGNCGICREGFVAGMARLKVLPPEVLEECRYDSFLDLRAAANQLRAKHAIPAAR